MAEEGWWQDYFDEDFIRIYQPLLPPEEAAAEAEAVAGILELSEGARLLDLGCGWGRHAVELAQLGFRVTGVDLSEVLLSAAQSESAARGVEVAWVSGDVRELPYHQDFDAVVSLFSSMGYFPSEVDDLRVLEGVRRALVPGGRLLVETMHRDLIARQYAERDWWRGPDGEPVFVEREFDAVTGVSREWLRWGAVEKYHEIRVRSATEWQVLLERAGFVVEEWWGGWDLEPFTHEAERLIIVASGSVEC